MSDPTEIYEIIVRRAKFGAAGQRYDVLHAGEIIVEGSMDPQSDAARELVAGGASMDSVLMSFNDSGPRPTLVGRMGIFAGSRVSEGQDHGPRIVPWTPYFGPAGQSEGD